MKRLTGSVVVLCLLISSAGANPPFLEGDVTDEQGRPIAGASVKIWDCVGTCLGGIVVLTDADGHYVFEKKPFRNVPLLTVSMPGRYEVSRDYRGPGLRDPEVETARRADFVLGSPAAATVRIKGNAQQGWKQTVVVRSRADAKVHRYDEYPKSNAGWDDWNFELLPRNEDLHLVVVREPVVEISDDPKINLERERVSRRQRIEIIAPPIRLIDPQRYDIRAVVNRDEASDTTYITFETIRDALGTDRTKELTQSASIFGPAVDVDLREQAFASLKRVEAAASPWNAKPPKSIASYEYDFINAKDERTHVNITHDSPMGPAWSDISRIRGFAYMPPLRWLFSQPENIVFHAVEITEEKATLQYRLKEPRGFSAGLGIGPDWNGFFSTTFSSGSILIDPRTATVLEHHLFRKVLGEKAIETFSDYVRVGEGYAPQSLRIQSGNFDLRLSFKIHENKLWLLDHACHGDDAKAVIQTENVRVKIAE